MNDTYKDDMLIEYQSDLADLANFLVAKSKEKQTNIRKVVYVDNDGNDVAENVYDFRYYYWKSTDTMDIVASVKWVMQIMRHYLLILTV